MNKKRIRKLADYIEKHPKHFDMACYAASRRPIKNRDRHYASYVYELNELPCDSVGCLAGLAVGLFWPRTKRNAHISIEEAATKVLRLEPWEATSLFYAQWFPGTMNEVTAKDAVKHLRSLAG